MQETNPLTLLTVENINGPHNTTQTEEGRGWGEKEVRNIRSQLKNYIHNDNNNTHEQLYSNVNVTI